MDIGSLAGSTSKYDIPVSHLEYGYIEKCTDAKYLEKIIKILRSGEEGKYPDLENFAEKKLLSLNPKSKVLRKDVPIQKITDLPRDQRKEISEDLDSWVAGIKSDDHDDCVTNGDLADIATSGTEFPIRNTTVISSSESSQTAGKASGNGERKTPKRVKPRDYREWDRLDVDAEIEKLEEEEKQESTKANEKSTVASPKVTSGLTRKVVSVGMSKQEREQKADREKDKGNEAFRAGDYTEAEIYYTRSLSLIPSIAARNNRAQAYLKLQEWDKAIADTNDVIKADKNNIKAHLRRGVAYQGKSLFIEAKRDLDKVLSVEPNNKRAKEVLSEVEKSLAEQKTKGRRMMIEESDSSDEEEEEEEEPERQGTEGEEAIVKTTQTNKDPDPPVCKMDIQASEAEDTSKGRGVNSSEEATAKTSGTEEESEDSDKGEGTPEGTADVVTENSQSEKLMEEPEAEEREQEEDTVQQTEQPPAVEPAPPLPDDVIKLKDEGTQLFKAGRYAEALETYNKAIVHIEKDSRQSQNLGVLYSNRAACKMKTGDLKGCVGDCDLALTLNPNTLKPLLRRAHACEGLEKYRQAYVDYRQALFIDPSAEAAKQGSARCQTNLLSLDGPKWREKLPLMSPSQRCFTGRLPPVSAPKAEKVPAQKVKVEETVDKGALFDEQKDLGNEFVKKSDFQSAIMCYTKCVESCPDRSVAYTNRALCYLRTNQAALALRDCQEASRLEPSNVKALFRQGQAYKMLKDYDASEKKLREVIRLEPHNSAAKRELQVVLKYKEEEKMKSKAEPKRKKIVIEEESSSEESEEESTETPQKPSVQTGQVPQSRSQTESLAQHITEQAKDSSHSSVSSDVSAQTTPHSEAEGTSKTISSSGTSQKSSTETAGDKPETKQEVKPDAVHSGKSASGDVKYDLKVPKASSKIRPTAQMNMGSKSTSKLTKASAFEFMSTWSALKSPQDITPYLDLLVQVQPKQLPSVISNKLEGEMLPVIGKCAGRLADEGQAEAGYEYLKYLTLVPRFQMNTMFMSEPDKRELRSVFKKFKTMADPSFTPSDIDVLYRKYGL